MIGAATNQPNWLQVAANAAVTIGALYGLWRYALKAFRSLIGEQVLPLFQAHTEADLKQTEATNATLRQLKKSLKQHQKNDEAQFNAIGSQLDAIAKGVNGR